MNREEFDTFVQTVTFNGEKLEDQVEETHISWICFTKDHVFKIKKPVKLSFLDFSSLAKRKKYCERELMLNRRFSTIYLNVLPVIKGKERWIIGEGEGEVQDYAVQMKRMTSSKRMDKMLKEDKVTEDNMQALAKQVAFFHQNAEILKPRFDLEKAKALFNDIAQMRGFVKKEFGQDQESFVLQSMEWSNHFLEAHAFRIQERIEKGFLRDLHGDLHAGNIFLYNQPVLFDCIEFNDAYRQIDVLYETAFLCMELEAEAHENLSSVFLAAYSKVFNCFEHKEDYALFNYYKCLRANVRAKVLAISTSDDQDEDGKGDQIAAILNYLLLMQHYMDQIKG